MNVTELDYDLPDRLVAQRPAERREQARLMVVDADTGTLDHRGVADLPGLVRPALVVVNDTRVRPARLLGVKPTGGRVELLLVEPLGDDEWSALGRASKPIREGVRLTFGDGALVAEVLGREDGGALRVRLEAPTSIDEAIEAVGHVPLPPYIRRDADADDRERYQTVFARQPGAVAAPTAGLHFSEASLDALEAAGHERVAVTLHVGPGTFRPVKTDRLDEHAMHTERYRIDDEVAAAIARAKAEGRPVLAVGTTVVRTLEAAALPDGSGVAAGAGATKLFIRPPRTLRVVDALLTNFHLPRSTLIALVMSAAGIDVTRRAYAEAVRAEYRFFSYGDAMLVRDARSRP